MNRSKARGTTFESAVVAYLHTQGFPHVERRALAGSKDRGDIAGIGGWTVELKAPSKDLDVAGALREAKVEAGNAGTALYAAILKRRNHSIADSYVVLDLATFAAVIRD